MPRTARPWQERVREHFDEGDPDECWIWRGAPHEGYGRIRLGGRGSPHISAQLAVWTLLVGPVDDGLVLDHLCGVRLCVNPSHLEPVTPRENTLRGNAPSAQNARLTECARCGGPFSTFRTGDRTYRRCRSCWNANRRERRAR